MKNNNSFGNIGLVNVYVSPNAVEDTALDRAGTTNMFKHNTNLVTIPEKLTVAEIIEAIEDFSFLSKKLCASLLGALKSKVPNGNQILTGSGKDLPEELRLRARLGDTEEVEIEIKAGEVHITRTDGESQDLDIPDFLIDLFKDEGIPSSVVRKCLDSDELYSVM